jgi:hypothetical protein
MATEVEFANKFIEILKVTNPSIESQNEFINSFNLRNINKLPNNFTFPPLKNPSIKNAKKKDNINNENNNEEEEENDDNDEMETAVEFTFKSLKQPKFNLNLILDIKSTTTIFHIKSLLSNALKSDDNISILVDPADIKLMIRTKTLQDSESVVNVLQSTGSNEKISLNVLISKFQNFQQPIDNEPKESNVNEIRTISNESWQQISEILLNDLKDQNKVDSLISNWKNSL